jgi:exocyst complex component 8
VVISKEISVLENEMLELKELISDYRSMPQMLHIPDPTTISSNMLSTYKRSSVADLKVLYFNQMQDLHSSVEGAAKFVPVTPGRHVVGEFENVMSLNAATYKIAHKVKFVVLDDAVLVAKRRRRKAGADGPGTTVNEGKLVAELCWALNDMVVLDTKDSPCTLRVHMIAICRSMCLSHDQCLQDSYRQEGQSCLSNRNITREKGHPCHVSSGC